MIQLTFALYRIKATPKDNTVIIVSGTRTNSISADIFKLGDRILFINGTKITDTEKCACLLETSGGDFDVFLERPPKGLLEYGIPTAPVIDQVSFFESIILVLSVPYFI